MSNVIKAIERSTVHRICSGQVVLSLAIAVKELVENAIDAGATTVEIKLKEYGSDMIEVSDNGHGVHPENFEGLTLKHHTSKLRDFSDLTGVETFGFRGEALSSLCALSDLTVSTRHTSQECGSNLIFDRNGRIITNAPCARQIGTTVSLVNIFSTLPVRHKEFHRNLKKEFNKMLQLLYAYCLVSVGVRISCSNQTKKGNKSIVLATQGNLTVKENVSSIFGSKQLSGLIELKTALPSPEILDDLKLTEEACSLFKLDGLVSSCAHGSGRGAPDRQFYFINSRPCDPAKISKTVNEVYHQYNLHQYPFVFLNILVAKEAVDVNVTPDKRQIFLDNEKLLIAVVKASLEKVYKSIPSSFTLNNVPIKAVLSPASSKTSGLKPNLSIFSQWKSKNDSNKRVLESSDVVSSAKVMKLDSNLGCKARQETLSGYLSKVASPQEPAENSRGNVSLMVKILEPTKDSEDMKRTPEGNETQGGALVFPHVEKSSPRKCAEEDEEAKTRVHIENCEMVDLEYSTMSESSIQTPVSMDSQKEPLSFETELSEELSDVIALKEGNLSASASTSDLVGGSETLDTSCEPYNGEGSQKTVVYDSYVERDKKYVVVPFDVSFVKSTCKERIRREDIIDKVIFRAAIDPSKNDQAETELRREISKDKFKKMKIIGQFNLGFIIAKLDKDLFIIDQHASDEKYNFETLQKTTVINNQKLVVPQPLELTAANESILVDNLEVFKKNGFEFKIDADALPTQKVSMTAVPLSVNRVFGKEDVDELLFMLQDADGKDLTCRPSGVRAMFASRACRKSVMIGTALDHREMRRLVSQMGTIEHPWNCPHGRPTMRHLVNIELVKKV